MHLLLDQMLKASSQQEAQRRIEEAAEELEEKASAALAILEDDLFDATAVLALPERYRRRLHTTNMLERLIQEIRRREKVIRIFPSEASAWRLISALLAEKREEWSTGRAISLWARSTSGGANRRRTNPQTSNPEAVW
jgi:transposase-like protein